MSLQIVVIKSILTNRVLPEMMNVRIKAKFGCERRVFNLCQRSLKGKLIIEVGLGT